MNDLSAASVNADVPPTADDRSQWDKTIAQWKEAVATFQTNYENLLRRAPIGNSSPALQRKYRSAMDEAASAKVRIAEINSALADVQAWLSGAWTSFHNVWSYISGKVSMLFGYEHAMIEQVAMGELGQVIMIPVAVVAVAIAYIAARSMDLYQTNQKLDTVKEYVAKGYTPLQAANAVAKTIKTTTPGLFSSIEASTKWLAIAVLLGGGLYVYVTHQRRIE